MNMEIEKDLIVLDKAYTTLSQKKWSVRLALKKYARENNISQKKLGEALGTSQQGIANIFTKSHYTVSLEKLKVVLETINKLKKV